MNATNKPETKTAAVKTDLVKPGDKAKPPVEQADAASPKVETATSGKPVVTEPVSTPAVDQKPEPAEKPKSPTKAEKAKVIYDDMTKDGTVDHLKIIVRFKKEVGLTTAGAQTYFYKFQKEAGRTTVKGPSKMDKAQVVFDKMTADGQARKDIIAAFVKEAGLTKAGAQTYYQNLKKKAATNPAKSG